MAKRHKSRIVKVFTYPTNELELDPNKFIIKQEEEGVYAIYNITQDFKIMVKRIQRHKDSDALEEINSLLEHINKDL